MQQRECSWPTSTGILQADTAALHTSPHFMTRTEAIRGAANRVLFSQFYILLYLSMAILSCVTVWECWHWYPTGRTDGALPAVS